MKNVQDVYRLSPVQRALLAQPAPGVRIEHLHWAWRRGLDVEALELAFRELVARHPALRTAIFTQGMNEPLQVVREKLEPRVERHELPALAGPERAERLDAFLAEDRRRGLNLTAAPLVRLSVLCASPEAGVVVFSYHPLVIDAASALLCVEELLRLYAAAREKRALELERAPAFRDYISWLEQQSPNNLEARLREPLRGLRPSKLPELAGAGAPDADAPPYVTQQAVLSPAATGDVQVLVRQHKVGLGIVLQAAWAALLRQHLREDTVLFGAVASGRPASLAMSATRVGRFSNLLPRRVTVPASGPVLRWLRGLQAEHAEAQEHAHVSPAQLRPWLEATPDSPLFQSAVTVDGVAADDSLKALGQGLGFYGLTHVPADLPAPLTVSAVPGSRLVLQLRYDPRRFAPLTITRLAGQLGTLVEELARQPEREPRALPPLPALESPARAPITGDTGIGPSELEAVLAQHPSVRAVTVVPAQGAPGGLLARVVPATTEETARKKRLDFSLFYFANEDAGARDKYRAFLDGARLADRSGFSAIWTPERHFDEHGGLYPNPSILAAALSTITERISLRAGSVVLPIQHPLRVAEEWAVVDNLSGGRAAIAVTAGWVPNDFSLAPAHYANKREVMFQHLEQVRQLWRGVPLPVLDGVGNPVALRAYPRPIQPELPVWLTCPTDPVLFEKAGEMGINVLTALASQSVEEVTERIALYRRARERAGHDPAGGTVSLMLHTHVGGDADEVMARVREPLTRYLRSHLTVQKARVDALKLEMDINDPKLLDDLATFAFELHARSSALIGTPTTCLPMVDRLIAAGVDEVACFVDFGVETNAVLDGLRHLVELKQFVDDEALRTSRVLTEYLDTRLPGHMRPVSFQLVTALP